MKSMLLRASVYTSLLVCSSPLLSATPKLMLLADDIKACASEQTRYCSSDAKSKLQSDKYRQAPIYAISYEGIERIRTMAWTDQPDLREHATHILSLAQDHFKEGTFTQREFERFIRRSDATLKDSSEGIREYWFSLFTFEQQNFFDLLEQSQGSKTRRLKTAVDLENTRNWVTKEAMNELLEQAQSIVKAKRKPRISFVTGGSRDPYREVDYFEALFEDAGFEANWLAIDGAMQTVISRDDEQLCDQLAQFQVSKLASFRRDELYPDLFQQQQALCRDPDELFDMLRKSDVVYIADSNPLLLYQAFYDGTGKASELLQKMQDMAAKGQLIVAAQGDAINALVGGQNNATILSGEGAEVLTQRPDEYVNGFDACNLGVDCISLVNSRSLSMIRQGVMNLFPWGTIDTQVGRKGNQPRLIKTGLFSASEFIFGLDNDTYVSVFVDEQGNPKFEVKGSGGMWIGDLRQSKDSLARATQFGPFDSYYLTHGDQFEINKSMIDFQFAPWKYAVQVTNGGPDINSSSPFNRSNYQKLSQMQCNTGAVKALGNADDFELTLSASGAAQMRKGTLSQGQRGAGVCSFARISAQILPKQL